MSNGKFMQIHGKTLQHCMGRQLTPSHPCSCLLALDNVVFVSGYWGSEPVTEGRHSALIQAATFSLTSINIRKFALLLLDEGIKEL